MNCNASRAERLAWLIQHSVPSATAEALLAYQFDGLDPGSFVRACVENSFVEAVGRADEFNRKALSDISIYLHQYVAANKWGNPVAVAEWKAFCNERRTADSRVKPYGILNPEGLS